MHVFVHIWTNETTCYILNLIGPKTKGTNIWWQKKKKNKQIQSTQNQVIAAILTPLVHQDLHQ